MLSPRLIARGFVAAAAVAAVIGLAAGASWPGTPGEARLVAFEPMANFGANETCEWEVAGPQFPSYAAAGAVGVGAAQLPPANARLAVAKRPPTTFIQDPYPSWSSIAVDPMRNEIVMTD